MSRSLAVPNFGKTYPAWAIDKTGCDIGVDEERNHLLLSTTFGLNSSHSKKIQVGLQATNVDSFVPIVKLIGKHVDGICFDVDTWQQFQQSCMEYMRVYFCENQKTKPDPIIVGNIAVNFTSAYGSRAVMTTYKESSDNPLENDTETGGGDQEPKKKKRKTFDTAVVMQKTTFLGLDNILKCVNEHLSRLVSIADAVDSCVKYTISEIELKLPTSYVDREIIKLTVKGNYEDIKQNVQKQIKNLPFLDSYFNIIFVELLSLQSNTISRIILSKR